MKGILVLLYENVGDYPLEMIEDGIAPQHPYGRHNEKFEDLFPHEFRNQ